MTVKVRFIGSKHDGLQHGDIVYLSDGAYSAFEDKFELVDRDENKASGGNDPSEDYPVHTGGGWYELPNGDKVQGKEKAMEMMENVS